MKTNVRHEGDQWGRMTVLRAEVHLRQTKKTKFGRRRLINQHEIFYTIQCDCGRIRHVWQGKMKAKKYQMDCGCGLAEFDKPGVQATLSFPEPIIRKIRLYAEGERINFSRAACRLMEGRVGDSWDWRYWDGATDLPESCWKYNSHKNEPMFALNVGMPEKMLEYLMSAAAWYGVSLRRIAAGLVDWNTEGEHGITRRKALAREIMERKKAGVVGGEEDNISENEDDGVLSEEMRIAGADEI